MGEMEQLTWLAKQSSKIPHTSEQLISQGFLPEAIICVHNEKFLAA